MSCTPKVSVIIPVYNTAEFLRQCLDSIVNQTLQDIEIICVDDGSTDASLDILHEYASNDSRITILTQQNKGGGAARNAGIQIAHGEYLAFFDSDDFFDLRLLEKVTRKGDATNADIVMFGAKHYNNQTHEFSPMDYILNKKCLPNKDPFSPLDIPDCIFQLTTASPWSKLFRRSFSEKNGLKFQELHNTNDVFYVTAAFSVAQRISWVNKTFVSYRVGLKSNTQSKKDAYPLDFYRAFLAWRAFLVKQNLYSKFEKSFLNSAAEGLRHNFSTISVKALPKYARENIAAEFGLELLGKLVVVPDEKHLVNTDTILSSGIPYIVFKPELTPQAQIVCDTRDASVQPFISVIIPIYNVEKYLKECLDSVVNQTLHNIEVICVDDGSTDSSLEIAKSYAANDNRFIILHQVNKGLGAARNTGFAYARGYYVQFLDSDDAMALNSYEILYERAASQNLDILRFACEVFYDNDAPENSFPSLTNFNFPQDDILCTTGEHIFCVFSARKTVFASACMAVYRSSYLRSISLSFIEGILHEDNPFTFLSILETNHIGYIPQAFYLRRIRNDSIMTTTYTYRNLYGCLVSYYYLCSFFLNTVFLPETQKHISIKLDYMRHHINYLCGEIPDVSKYCTPYELSLLRTLNPSITAEYNKGCILASIPRKGKKFVQYLHEYGIGYTINKTFHFIAKIFGKFSK